MANGILRELRTGSTAKNAPNGKATEANASEPARPVAPVSEETANASVGGAKRALPKKLGDAVLDRVDGAGLNRALLREAKGLARHPVATAKAVGRFAGGSVVATAKATARAVGSKTEGPLPVPAKDRRFNDPAWRENALFYALLQLHLLRERLARDLVDASGLEQGQRRKARLASQLLVDALSPSNFFLSNPTAIKRAFETGGHSVLRGMKNFAGDVTLRGGWPRQVDASGFEVGRNLACTPGKVVYRNALMELIQYTPQTPNAYAVPLLCSPPWINKYYIMDLAPKRSFIEWAVKHGHTTFVISYRNPDEAMRDVALDDYLVKGVDEAVRVVREITGAPKVNLVGLCLGGTIATAYTAWQREGGEDLVNTLTLLNTLVDFAEPGILGSFTDPETVAAVERMMANRGFLDAGKMANTFNLIRATDLVFNYMSTNWLAGEEPQALDLLAWNGDNTRMPARMHGYYLKTCYVENQLAKGQMTLAGRKLDLRKCKQETFVLAAVEDHIAPWHTQFKTTQLLPGDTRFVLSSSGHIAGIVNPPGKSATHWTNEAKISDPEKWLDGAKQHHASWWEEWSRWIGERSGATGAPPAMGGEKHKPLCDAPGTYVRDRVKN